MKELILLIPVGVVGVVGGFFAHTFAMKVNFKQRVIENKIKVFDSLIGTWVQMRNFIFSQLTCQSMSEVPRDAMQQFDQMYGQSQQLIGEAILVCEDEKLTEDINMLNERIYRTEWYRLEYARANEEIEQIKQEAMRLIARMRNDIKDSTRFYWWDISHIASDLWPCRPKVKHQ